MFWLGLVFAVASAPATSPAIPHQPVGQVLGKTIYQNDLGFAGPIDPNVQFDARDQAMWDRMKRVQRVFGGPLIERFMQQQKIEASEQEVNAFVQTIERIRGEAPENPRAGAPDVKRARAMARQFILPWKLQRELHRKYGGRIIFQQFGPEAIDGMKRLFEDAEKAGDLRIEDAGLRHLFYYYVNMPHAVIDDPDALEKPWFLQGTTRPTTTTRSTNPRR